MNVGTDDLPWDEMQRMFMYLKQKGVIDPDVDMFVAIFEDDIAGLKAALGAGADTTVTDREVLIRHRADLSDFQPETTFRAPTEEELARLMERADSIIGGEAGKTVEHFGRAAMLGSAEDRQKFRRLINGLGL